MRNRKDVICNKCGCSNQDEAIFCKQCGSKLEIITGQNEEEKVICINCGEENNSDSKFCKACGNSLLDNYAEKDIIGENPEKRKRKKLHVILIIMAVLVILTATILTILKVTGNIGGASKESGFTISEDFSVDSSEDNNESDTNDSNGNSDVASSVVIRSAEATSEYVSKKTGYRYSADLLIDNDYSTAWTEGAEGDGVGEFVKLYLDSEDTIVGLNIYNGYGKSSEIFKKNNRVEKMYIEFDDGKAEDFCLDDSMDGQRIMFEEPHTCSSFCIIIESVYPGDKYNDTCISEISLIK